MLRKDGNIDKDVSPRVKRDCLLKDNSASFSACICNYVLLNPKICMSRYLVFAIMYV